MSRKAITDSTNKIIGYTEKQGSKEYLLSESGRIIGYYDAQSDKTFEASNRYVGSGYQLMRLLRA